MKKQLSSKKKAARRRGARTKPCRSFRSKDLERLSNIACRLLVRRSRRRPFSVTNANARDLAAQMARSLARKYRLEADSDDARFFAEALRDRADKMTGRDPELD
jgi:hypothetical protein